MLKKVLGKKLLFFLFAVLSFSFAPKSSQALMTETIGILPAYPNNDIQYSDSWFLYNLNLGESKLDAVRLVNNKEETVVIKIYAVDAISTVDGGFALLQEEAEKKDVGGWVKLAVNEVELAPKTEKLIPFTFSVPADADMGDHAGGIVIQEVEMDEGLGGTTGMRIISRVGVRIYETVPGEVKKGFELTRFDWRMEMNDKRNFIKDLLDINRKTFFFVGIKNKGNIRLTPKATIEVRNMLGIKIAELTNQELGVVFPRGENGDSAVSWEGAPFFGRYKMKATVRFAEEGIGEDSREIAVWVFPYRLIFIGTILAVFMMLIRLIGLYFREAAKEKMPIYQVKLGDNLADLGRKFMVPWRKVAKLNFIGEPFEIKEGERLFIPVNKKNQEIINRLKERGELLPSILERSRESRFKRKKTFLIIAVLFLVGAGAVWGIKVRRDKLIREQITIPKKEVAPPKETAELTKSGAFKKSNVEVAIFAPSRVDNKSSNQLFKKFKLMGYAVKLENLNLEKNYELTTVEYRTGKEKQAEMVKNDLDLKEVALQEVPDLGYEVAVYNLFPAEAYFDLEHAAATLNNVE